MLTYRNFMSDKSFTFPVAPYCLKMFQRRWYLLANSVQEDKMRLYGLDRIVYVETTDKNLELPEDFDAQDYFDSFFGVVLDDSKPVQRNVTTRRGD